MVFSQGYEFVASYHAAKRWVERAGGNIDVALEALPRGIKEGGKLLSKYGDNFLFEWCGLIFPCQYCKRTNDGQTLIVKSTLLWGMPGGFGKDIGRRRGKKGVVE